MATIAVPHKKKGAISSAKESLVSVDFSCTELLPLKK
jgi:hypothetical protein